MKRFAVVSISSCLAVIALGVVLEWKLRADAAMETAREARTRMHPFLQVLPADTYVNGLNDYRFRGEAITVQKPPHTFRIFTMGGSTTLGIRNTYSQTYPAILEKLLSDHYPGVRIEVQNAGVDWYTTIHVLVNYALRVRDFHPDLVIVFVAMNDLYRSFSPPWWAVGAYKPDYSHYLGPFVRFLGPEVEFATGSEPDNSDSGLSGWLLWKRLRHLAKGDPSPYDLHPDNAQRLKATMRAIDVEAFRSLDSYRTYYDLLVRTIQQDGVAILMASEPFLYNDALGAAEERSLFFGPVFCAENNQYPNVSSLAKGMRRFNAAAQEVASGRNVPFLDFEAIVPDTSAYFADDIHLTGAGNEILARSVYDWITSRGLVNRSP